MKEQEPSDNNTSKNEEVQLGDKKYPKWAVDKAKQVVEARGGTLESALAGILLLDEAKQKVRRVDTNAPGTGHSHHIGGHVVRKRSDFQESDK